MSFSDDTPRRRKTPVVEHDLGDVQGTVRYGDPFHTRDFGNTNSYPDQLDREPAPARREPSLGIRNSEPVVGQRAVLPDEQDYARYQDRMRRPRAKICGSCGGIMRKTSRRILSAPAGVGLIALGAILMVFYGLATNFYQVPWYLTFALPAAYYVGSVFMGVGIIFFFIRERVWICRSCREMSKR